MSGLGAKLGVAGALAAFMVSETDAANGIALRERSDHVTEGSVVINAPPEAVYDLVTDYPHWPAVFSDVESVRVEAGNRDRARVRFRSRAFRYDVTVQFNNVPGRAIRFRGVKGPPGSRASGEYVLTPIDGGRRTRLTARLYLDIVGASSMFVSQDRLRGLRRAKLQADLRDAARYFAGRSQMTTR